MQSSNVSKRLSALMVQYPNGKDREPTFSVFWRNDKREEREEIDRVKFWNLYETAGEPAYSEPNYWSY